MPKKDRPMTAVHPGEILREHLMEPLGISINQMARELRVSASWIRQLVSGRRALTADTALRLARYFGSFPQFWLNLQTTYELETTSRASAAEIARDVNPR